MFAVGDKVFYRGKGVLPKNIPLQVQRIVNGFVYVDGNKSRYHQSSFNKDVKVVQSLSEELTEKANQSRLGNCYYALEFEDGTRRFQVPDICHARLPFGRDFDERGKQLKAVSLNISRHLKDESHASRSKMIRMYDYILHRSPWKDMFIKNDNPYEGSVLLDIDKPYSLCVSAAIALRTVSEFVHMREMFIRMVDLGIQEDIAYIASVNVTRNNDGQILFSQYVGSHHVLNLSHLRREDIRDFFFKGKHNCLDKPYKESPNLAYSVWNCIGEVDHKRKLEDTVMGGLFDKLPADSIQIIERWGDRTKYILGDTDKQVVSFCVGIMSEMLK